MRRPSTSGCSPPCARDVPGVLEDGVDALAWHGPTDALESVCEEIGAPELPARARALAAERAAD